MSKRVHFIFIILLSLVFIIFSLMFFLFTIDTLISQVRVRGISDIRQIVMELDQAFRKPGNERHQAYQSVARKQSERIPAHIIVVDTASNLLADSQMDEADISGRYINADIADAKEYGTAGSTFRISGTPGLSITIAKTHSFPRETVVVYLVYSIPEFQGLYTAFTVFGAGLPVLVTALIILIVSYMYRGYQKPIRKLIQHTSAAVHGGFSKISIDTGNQELSQLVVNFNSLVDRYNGLVKSDNWKYSRINTLLSNLSTGIIMVNLKNEIIMVNPMAEELLNLNKLNLFNVRRNREKPDRTLREILNTTREVNSSQNSISLSLSNSDNQILEIHADSIKSKYRPYEPSGALVILRDVTEIRRMEKLKDEFVSNVSHELRTPLTVISGFVETLKSWETLSVDDRTTALNIVDIETERLKKLVSELLHLSKIEGRMGSEKNEYFNPADIIREVAAVLTPLGVKKEITTEITLPESVQNLCGVSGWYRQIVYNLYDNAIKYTSPGGTIQISISEEQKTHKLEVMDNGSGIPEKCIENIFDRFFRADHPGKKKVPGSGLGLTITKYIVEEFSGTINVESSEEKGSIFTVRIPQGES